MSNLWDYDIPVTDFDIDVPAWIEQDITACDIAEILQGGCESGAYMPAVTYLTALDTMREHGDNVLDFIQAHMGELPTPAQDVSWSGLACFYLSYAVELWASSIEDDLQHAIDEKELEEESA